MLFVLMYKHCYNNYLICTNNYKLSILLQKLYDWIMLIYFLIHCYDYSIIQPKCNCFMVIASQITGLRSKNGNQLESYKQWISIRIFQSVLLVCILTIKVQSLFSDFSLYLLFCFNLFHQMESINVVQSHKHQEKSHKRII